jgi:hypothetical protein
VRPRTKLLLRSTLDEDGNEIPDRAPVVGAEFRVDQRLEIGARSVGEPSHEATDDLGHGHGFVFVRGLHIPSVCHRPDGVKCRLSYRDDGSVGAANGVLMRTPPTAQTEAMDNAEEERAVEDVIDRLIGRFPDVPREYIVTVVHETHLELEGNPIRDFVPVLVEKQAKKRLRQEANPTPILTDDSAASVGLSDEPLELDPMEIERRSREREGGFLFGDLGGGTGS